MAVTVTTSVATAPVDASRAAPPAGLRRAQRPGALAPCIQAASLFVLLAPLAAHADLIGDSQLNLGLRNFYLDRDFRGDAAPISRAGSWSQGFDLRFTSGYTEGPLQFGLDASAQYAYRLDGGGGRGPDTVLPYDRSEGEQVRDYGRAALTAKVRHSKTELTVGEHRPMLPVAFFDDSRQLASTFHGIQITSKEIDSLSLTAGRFNEIATRESADHEKPYLFTRPFGPRHPSDGLNFAGGTYTFSPKLSATYFYGQLEDIYQQHYLGLTHNASLANGYSLKTDLRYYDNSTDGDALYGEIDNHTYGLLSSLKKGAHTFSLGYQRMLGDSGFPTLNGFTPQPHLVNWSALAFIRPNESSWQLRYDYDFAAQGLPGLRLMTRYLRGSGIKRAGNLSDSSESERDLYLSYVVQSGPLKGLGFGWLNIDAKVQHGSDFNENRLITTYTWKLW
ncbi:OprD family porin [Pseudomonas lalucatii]|uniref:OprD family porin n=2 Tax=Pseudomonas lalucatii TaxID=1424203 RepID=A0ABS5PWZ5_9PSED|nr:OprD family porin [Pseudomonas lalucatii]